MKSENSVFDNLDQYRIPLDDELAAILSSPDGYFIADEKFREEIRWDYRFFKRRELTKFRNDEKLPANYLGYLSYNSRIYHIFSCIAWLELSGASNSEFKFDLFKLKGEIQEQRMIFNYVRRTMRGR